MPLYNTWEEAQAAKQRARDQDDADIASGRKTREQVTEENGGWARKFAHLPIEWDKTNHI